MLLQNNFIYNNGGGSGYRGGIYVDGTPTLGLNPIQHNVISDTLNDAVEFSSNNPSLIDPQVQYNHMAVPVTIPGVGDVALIDGVAVNCLDPGLADSMRVLVNRDPANAYDRLLLRLYDVTKAEVDMDPGFVDMSDAEQVRLWKTVQVLNNRLLYADSYLLA